MENKETFCTDDKEIYFRAFSDDKDAIYIYDPEKIKEELTRREIKELLK